MQFSFVTGTIPNHHSYYLETTNMSANTHSRNAPIKFGIWVGSVPDSEVEAGSLPFWKPK
jgi:hypothetical protein